MSENTKKNDMQPAQQFDRILKETGDPRASSVVPFKIIQDQTTTNCSARATSSEGLIWYRRSSLKILGQSSPLWWPTSRGLDPVLDSQPVEPVNHN